jgi:glycosyltransferase involved in cell wall biosynthesis
MPKIAIDISPLSDGNSVRGVGVYTKNLVSALQKEVKTNPEYKNFSINLITDYRLPITNYDLVHYPYFNPFSLTLPFKKTTPTIISIHDVIERQFKNHYPVGIKGEINWQIQKYLARRADYIITISHYSKYQIAKILNYPADHIYVTYLAPDESYSYRHITDKKYLKNIKEKYHLPDKYVLYVGDMGWNKNIPDLCQSCIQLGYPLVIAGKQAEDINNLTLQKPSLFRPRDLYRHLFNLQSPQLTHVSALKELFKNQLIHRLGYVSNEDMPAIYQMATIYCQPSFAEGYCLNIVQAMKMGVPTIYSQETSLPEVMDYSGLFFDPYKPNSLTKALSILWNDEKLRKKYIKLGLERAKFFSWQSTAIQTLAVYQLALSHEK